jgi:hypothetical protein
MIKFGPKAQLTSIIDDWAPYYVERVGLALEGKWTTGAVWDGLDKGKVKMAPYTNMPEDVKKMAEATEAAIKNKTLHPFKCPIVKQDGAQVECKGNVHYSNEARRVYTSLGLDYVVLKRDGSLSDAGFEIVTRPDSLDIHKRKWDGFIKTASQTLTSWTNGRCGMHIHATRSALTQLQLGKMLVWINHPANESVVKTTAGRSLKSWACIETGKKLTDGTKLSPNRYVALNVRDETCELRIFRGTLKPESFYKNLEFYDALIAFCAPANHGCRDIETPQPFLKFVTNNVKSYPHLHEFYVRRGVYSRAGIEHEPTQVAIATQ